MTFPVYAAGDQPNGPYKDGPGEINVPISCGGVTVNPGDIIVGDADGLVAVPRQTAEAILEKARGKLRQELQTREAINAGPWNRPASTEEAQSHRGTRQQRV